LIDFDGVAAHVRNKPNDVDGDAVPVRNKVARAGFSTIIEGVYLPDIYSVIVIGISRTELFYPGDFVVDILFNTGNNTSLTISYATALTMTTPDPIFDKAHKFLIKLVKTWIGLLGSIAILHTLRVVGVSCCVSTGQRDWRPFCCFVLAVFDSCLPLHEGLFSWW
ncbi:hypothetical protein A2U01_0000031, partial [Trifolium medium]|nr:hypothetical protein [Trifolium medium]